MTDSQWQRCVLVPVFLVLAVLVTIGIVNGRQELAEAALRWDRGEDRPVAVTIARQDGTPTSVRLSITMSSKQIKEDWCHCSIHSRGFGKAIMRYPSVHEVQNMYKWASDSRQLVDQCDSYPIRNIARLDSFQVASTTDAISLTYAPDGKRLTVCFLEPGKLTPEDRVVLWSDSSPEGYP